MARRCWNCKTLLQGHDLCSGSNACHNCMRAFSDKEQAELLRRERSLSRNQPKEMKMEPIFGEEERRVINAALDGHTIQLEWDESGTWVDYEPRRALAWMLNPAANGSKVRARIKPKEQVIYLIRVKSSTGRWTVLSSERRDEMLRIMAGNRDAGVVEMHLDSDTGSVLMDKDITSEVRTEINPTHESIERAKPGVGVKHAMP